MVNITQSDIAKKLNVSRITVSKALRDHPDISAAMKKKVNETAMKLGYVPNLIATQLNSGRTSSIGIVVPDLENSFFSYVVDSMIDYATEKDYRVILTVSREKEAVEKHNIETLMGMRVDGLLVCHSQETRDTTIIKQIKKMKIPLVFFDRVIVYNGFSSIVFDDRKGAISALDIVIGSGFARIAHFAGYMSIKIGKERYRGYVDALNKNKIPLRKDWVLEAGYELEDGRKSFKKLLSLGDLPQVIFAVNDRVALGAYQAATDAGFKIPSDLGIMGYGFCETTNMFNPPLAVINQDPRAMGHIAAYTLLDEINGGQNGKPSRIKIDEEFIWGGSLKKVEEKE
jgi:LacI family transcriptional regulator